MNFLAFLPLVGGLIAAVLAAIVILNVLSWRVVVDTNKVHIIQLGKKTISYGVGADAGNVYYRVPAWIPVFGVSVTELPVNAFQMPVNGYNAYDKDRVPFDLDITAFFRIADTNVAANRVSTFEDLKQQLLSVVQGAVRKILASYDIHQIMTDRSTFGEQFTTEVAEGVKELGVVPTKALELMDIRDSNGSHVIGAIMKVKTSQIEADSRRAVAENERTAREAEIASKQSIAMAEQEAAQQLGERTAKQEQAVGIAKELAEQEILGQVAETRKKDMEVKSIETQRTAEINREAAVVKAEEEQRTAVIKAQAAKETTLLSAEAAKEASVLKADGDLVVAQRSAEGIKAKGEAEAAAKQAMETAPIQAQILLAKEIGENPGYQQYLISVRQVEATQAVGIAQADALKSADLKIIANGGDVASGITGLGDILTTKGGTGLAGALTALAATPEGSALVSRLTGVTSESSPPADKITTTKKA